MTEDFVGFGSIIVRPTLRLLITGRMDPQSTLRQQMVVSKEFNDFAHTFQARVESLELELVAARREKDHVTTENGQIAREVLIAKGRYRKAEIALEKERIARVSPEEGLRLKQAEIEDLHRAKTRDRQDLLREKEAEIETLLRVKQAELNDLLRAKQQEIDDLQRARTKDREELLVLEDFKALAQRVLNTPPSTNQESAKVETAPGSEVLPGRRNLKDAQPPSKRPRYEDPQVEHGDKETYEIPPAQTVSSASAHPSPRAAACPKPSASTLGFVSADLPVSRVPYKPVSFSAAPYALRSRKSSSSASASDTSRTTSQTQSRARPAGRKVDGRRNL
ncbi:hypothetical protein FB451DRAFT_1365883 [Mycena latifolia]|nr:hypothetical protein FB451DRAFT_1365883 [Mycena latifolia]